MPTHRPGLCRRVLTPALINRPIDYEVLGRTGAGHLPLVLTPGGGGGKGGFRWLAQRFKSGRQCLVWDRPNTGASGYTLGEDERQPEFDMQADYLVRC